MQEIKCPKCGEVFQVDESGYAAILKQVHDAEFDKEISRRQKEYEKDTERAVDLAVTKANADKDKIISDLQKKLELAKEQTELELAKVKSANELELASKDQEISQLKGQLELDKTKSESAVEKAVQETHLQRVRYLRYECQRMGMVQLPIPLFGPGSQLETWKRR